MMGGGTQNAAPRRARRERVRGADRRDDEGK